jgi:beta-galactosidase
MNRREFLGIAVAGAVSLAQAAASESTRTAPGENVRKLGRHRESFNADWLFKRQSHGGSDLGSWERNSALGAEIEPAFRNAHLPDYDDTCWQPVYLPHTWNAHDGSDDIPGYFRGIGGYRKHFRLEEGQRRKRVFLEFEGVFQTSEFWINGRKIGEHKGGYTSFELEITDHAVFGPDGNVLTVKVDNIYNPHIAPSVKTDVTFYGGIYRDVWLRLCEPVYISSVFWRTPRVSERSADLLIFAAVVNTTEHSASLKLTQEIYDPANQLVASVTDRVSISSRGNKELVQQCEPLKSPLLWSPDTPHLYRLRTILQEGGQLVDEVETVLGFRWFEFDANRGFFLNGKRLQLQGTTWHQSYPGMGNALPNSLHARDMKLIKEMGCNFFRTSHYPQDPARLEACDKLGILVLEELFIGEEIEDTPEYIDVQSKTAEEMILRDRNHPCVIMWGFSGEVDDPQKASAHVIGALLKKYRQLDPTRVMTMHDPRVEEIKAMLDVVGQYGSFKEDDEERARHPERKYMIEEYSAAGIGRGIYGMGPESEDLGCVKHEEFLAQVQRRPWMAGSVLWHQFDYDGEEYDPVIPHVVTFGMADSWRIPKDVFYFYQSQWSKKPMVHICGHWTWAQKEGKKRSVKVYSNAPEVELFLNGKSLGMKVEGEHTGLLHSPRIWEILYQPGTLTAKAFFAGKILSDERRTAGQPDRIVLLPDVEQILSGDRESLAYITAQVVDKDGTVVPNAFHSINFSSYGPGELLPQTWPGDPTGFTWNAVAGMTAIAFRATSRVGRAVISAYSPGLRLGRCIIQVVAKGKRDEIEYRSGAQVY